MASRTIFKYHVPIQDLFEDVNAREVVGHV